MTQKERTGESESSSLALLFKLSIPERGFSKVSAQTWSHLLFRRAADSALGEGRRASSVLIMGPAGRREMGLTWTESQVRSLNVLHFGLGCDSEAAGLQTDKQARPRRNHGNRDCDPALLSERHVLQNASQLIA